jgi:hypothetical protein
VSIEPMTPRYRTTCPSCRPGASIFVLAIGIEQIELRLQGIGAREPRRAHGLIASPGMAIEIA